MTTWNDFNDAEQQQDFDLIPKGTVARLRMTIKPGGYDDPAQGWVGGYATQSFETGSVYLACEFVVLDGEYAKRKLWSNVGLHSAKGPAWAGMGRSFLRAALNSARGVHPGDSSPQAAAARRIQGFYELDGLEFVGRIDIEKDGKGELRNVVKLAVEPDQPEYAQALGHAPRPVPTSAPRPAHAVPAAAPYTPPRPAAPAAAQAPVIGKPSWAQ